MIIAAAIVALIIAALAFLYTPAQQYYQSVRENARLQVEYDAIQQRNASLQAANDTLGTDAGVETALHERYGYVKEGEETANVSGLSAEASKNNSADKVEGNIQDDSIKAPDTWYSGVLDVVFGYDK